MHTSVTYHHLSALCWSLMSGCRNVEPALPDVQTKYAEMADEMGHTTGQ